MHLTLVVLRILHILGGIFWVGTALFNAAFLIPAMRAAGPAAAPVMAGLKERRMMAVMPAVAMVTVFAGFGLMWIMAGDNWSMYSRTTPGRGFTMAGGLAVLSFIVGLAFTKPATDRLMKLSAELAKTPAGPERTALEGRIAAAQRMAGLATTAVTLMLIVAAAGMAVARYV